MKQLISFFFLCAMLVACSQKSSNTFLLKGTVDGAKDGEYIFLTYTQGLDRENRVSDSVLIQNGQFMFRGEINQSYNATLYMGELYDRNNANIVSFFIEPNEMSVTLTDGNFKEYQLTGSVTNDEMNAIKAKSEQIMKEAEPILEALKNEPDHEKQAEIREELTPYHERVDQLYLDFIKEHPDAYLSAYLLIFQQGKLSFEELKNYYESFSERVKNSSFAQETKNEVEKLQAVQPGAVAPDFAAMDINGDSLKLSSFRGQYVLLDFWASWCVPCRKGNPHMKELYAQYHDKGLDVICVSDDDRSPDKWRKAVEQDGIEAFHHVLRGLVVKPNYVFDRTNSISDKYAIHYLPTKYLIDKEGKIIGQVKEEELDEKLKEIFGS